MAGVGVLLHLSAVLVSLSAVVAALFARLAPEPYMDEPFHVPQTQQYCAGRWWVWDPKITTFPGLYLLGAAVGRLEHAMQRRLRGPDAQLCSTSALRSVNLLFGAACLPLFYHAARRLDGSRTQQQLLLMTAACFFFPLHFFFTFLYYTDVPSLFFTLAAFLASQDRRYRLAAALGAAAVLMRQTNAVWVAFMLVTDVLDRCLPCSGAAGGTCSGGAFGGHGNGSSCSSGSGSSRNGQLERAEGNAGEGGSSPKDATASLSGASGEAAAGAAGAECTAGAPPPPAGSLLRDVVRLLRHAWLLKWRLAAELWPLAAVVAAFAAFVTWNGGIVVGDRANHAPVRHLVQPLYCLLYCTSWLAPVFWSPYALADTARQAAGSLRRAPIATFALVVAAGGSAAAAVREYTLVHPFLLADNRHYTFYLWRRLLNRTTWARYAAIPAYLFSGWALHQRLSHRGPLWVLLMCGATCAVLVPAHLVELRYFTVPFYLTFLHMRTPRPRSLAAVVALFAATNAATLYLFLARPFTWPDGTTARFLW